MIECTTCGARKAIDEFSIRENGQRRKQCKACRQSKVSVWHRSNADKMLAYHRTWSATNPERVREYRKRMQEKDPLLNRTKALRRYGLTLEDYENILSAQGGVCAACGEPELVATYRGKPRPLAIDHDHATGHIRGLLCSSCNVALGYARECPKRLRALAVYIESSTKNPKRMRFRRGVAWSAKESGWT